MNIRRGSVPRLVVYVSRGTGIHDQRILDVLASAFPKVLHLHTGRSQPHHQAGRATDALESRVRSEVVDVGVLGEKVASHRPDLIVAGPLAPEAEIVVSAVPHLPTVALSWGYDVHEPGMDVHALHKVATTAEVMILDNPSSLDLLQSHGIRPRHAHAMCYGIRLGEFPVPTDRQKMRARAWLDVPSEPSVLVTTRGWTTHHGTEEVIQWFTTDIRRAGTADWHLLVVGSGPREPKVRDALSPLITEGLATMHVGPLEKSSVRKALWAADYYASLSAFDGTSISVLEAMSTGLPVVASDIPSNQYVLGPAAGGGFLVDRDSPRLACARLPSPGSSLYRWMSRKARERARRIGNWSRHSRMLVQACQEAFARRVPTR